MISTLSYDRIKPSHTPVTSWAPDTSRGQSSCVPIEVGGFYPMIYGILVLTHAFTFTYSLFHIIPGFDRQN